MNLKHLYLLTGALSVAAIITYFIKNTDATLPADPRIGQAIVSNEDLQAVNTIVIRGDETLTLRRDGEQGAWTVEEKHGLPANMDMLGRVVSTLTEESLERLVSANPERIDRLGFGSSIAFYRLDESLSAKVEIGRLSDAGKQLVKYAEEDKAFLASGPINLNTDPMAWLDKALISFERDAARSVSVAFPDGEGLSVSRTDTGADWNADSPLPSGKTLDQDAITRAANRFANLTFTDLASLEEPDFQDAMANAQRYTLALADGVEYTFEIGRRPEVRSTPEERSESVDADVAEDEVTSPAGPVFVRIRSSQADAPINAYMERAAFEVAAYHYSSLPQSIDDLLQDQPEVEAGAPDEAENRAGEEDSPATGSSESPQNEGEQAQSE